MKHRSGQVAETVISRQQSVRSNNHVQTQRQHMIGPRVHP
jgi:hypothetical protein